MNFEQLDKELHQDKGFYTQQFELNKKIQQLEKELKNIKQENYVMNGLLNGKEKEIVKDLQKLKDMQDECDTCMRQYFGLNRLKKELKEAKAKLTANRFIFNTNKRHKYQDAITELQLNLVARDRTIEDLDSKLANQKYLDRKEVEKIITEFKTRIVSVEESFNKPDCPFVNYDFTIQTLMKNCVTAICNLVLPQVRTSPFTDEQDEIDREV